MQPNPYTPSGRPRVFVGRERERQRLRDQLARVVAYGEMMGPLTVVTGPRGVGKTSLLRDVGEQAAENGLVVAWVSAVKQQPILGELIHQVRTALERAEVLDPKSARRVEEVGVEVSAGIAKVSAKIGSSAGWPAEAPAAVVGPVQDFLRHTSNLVRERGGAGLLVVIDELHAPLESRGSTERDPYDPEPQAVTDAGVLLNVTQNMDAERQHFPVAVIGAGLPQTKALLTRAATFGERTHELVLGEMDHATAEAVLVEPARRLGVEWSSDALAAALEDADGYPQTLQIIGSATWEAARPEQGAILEVNNVILGRRAALAEMTSLFHTRWAVASEAEREFLTAMAQLPESMVSRAAIAAELGVDTDALGMTRRSLIGKGIIEAPQRGQLRFTIPGFAEYVRGQVDDSEH
ncbi:ATP-binding protein [Nocardioides sp.]|uniref:ATP-binding protein n=1 Tax=Nocardioides sp. TaxID=35761 RepID=UPI002735185C|nr:ATP-binding protein [Nocardioides sp.]MDP3893624.1 ATP-binding protein [Nocardioides sp.]